MPGRTVGGYVNLIEARLRKLAATRSTGLLPMSGHGDGAIFFRGGRVPYAESTRTPTPARRTGGLAALGLAATDASPPSDGGEPGAASSIDRLVHLLALTEPIIDAITELLSSESRYAKFRPGDDPSTGPMSPLPIEAVLTEVERRRQVLRQLAPVVTSAGLAPSSGSRPVTRTASRCRRRGIGRCSSAPGAGARRENRRPGARPERLRHHDRGQVAAGARPARRARPRPGDHRRRARARADRGRGPVVPARPIRPRRRRGCLGTRP